MIDPKEVDARYDEMIAMGRSKKEAYDGIVTEVFGVLHRLAPAPAEAEARAASQASHEADEEEEAAKCDVRRVGAAQSKRANADAMHVTAKAARDALQAIPAPAIEIGLLQGHSHSGPDAYVHTHGPVDHHLHAHQAAHHAATGGLWDQAKAFVAGLNITEGGRS